MSVNWKNSIIIVIDAVLAVYLLVAVTVYNKPESKDVVCTRVDIRIADGLVNGFLDNVEVESQLKTNRLYPLGQPLSQVDVRNIEESLQRNPFVKEAQCYKTQGGKVIILLTQRLPVMRVKAENGDDYYLDGNGNVMPRTRYTSDLIVATGHISRNYAKTYLATMGEDLLNNRFWNNQIEQLHVLQDGSMELVPRVGDHIVYLGSPIDIPQKLTRLEKFYRYGLNVAGWNKYSYINLEFNNQIICKKRETRKP